MDANSQNKIAFAQGDFTKLLLKHHESSTVYTSEIFYSLQGEGPRSGVPAIFLRLSGCNLRCEWGSSRCDTPYTSWDAQGEYYSVLQILEKIGEHSSKTKTVIITGGEPTIAPKLDSLCDLLKSQGYEVHLETNGTGKIPEAIDLVVCSPKLGDSVPRDPSAAKLHEANRAKLHPSVFELDKAKLYLKFVVTKQSDTSEIEALVEKFKLAKDRVYIMPEGSKRGALKANELFAADYALLKGFSYSSRLHVALWDDARGV